MFTVQITFQYKQPWLFLQRRCESGADGGAGSAGKEVTSVCLRVCDGDGENYGVTGWPEGLSG